MNRDLVVDEELSCNSFKNILPNTINKTLLNDHQCLTLYDMHLKQVKFESNTFINNSCID